MKKKLPGSVVGIDSAEIDHASLALHKEHMAKVAADMESVVEKQMQSMSAAEQTKFQRFVSNIRFLGDVGVAAGKSRVGRKLLDKWMNTLGLSWKINSAVNEGRLMAHTGQSAPSILFRSKVLPELEKDAEFFAQTGQRHRESKVIAKLAAKDLKRSRWDILQAANNLDRNFFIDLGRILSGEVSGDLYDKLDEALAELWDSRPNLSTARSVAELRRRGIECSDEAVRQRKKRLGLTKSNRKL
jgi:hypothetical protein